MERKLLKKQFPNCREYTKALVEMTKAGIEIDLNHTYSMFGRIYTIAYYEDVVAEQATSEVELATEQATTDVTPEAEVAPNMDSEQSTPEATTDVKPAAKGRPAKAK